MNRRVAEFTISLLMIPLCLALPAPNAPPDSAQLPDLHNFDLTDMHGRRVKLADYAGRPIFLEFGACW